MAAFRKSLAEGVMKASRKIGGAAPDIAIYAMNGNTPRGHDHRLAALRDDRLSADHYLHRAFQHLDQRVERRGVFAQPCSSVKGEHADGPGLAPHDLAAHDRASLVFHQRRQD